MALIRCPSCGKIIPENSEICVHCGYVFPSTAVSTVEMATDLSDDAIRLGGSSFGPYFEERKIRHRWDKLCFFVPPVGMYLTITFAFEKDKRWKNSLWSTFLGSSFYFCIIALILGFFQL